MILRKKGGGGAISKLHFREKRTYTERYIYTFIKYKVVVDVVVVVDVDVDVIVLLFSIFLKHNNKTTQTCYIP